MFDKTDINEKKSGNEKISKAALFEWPRLFREGQFLDFKILRKAFLCIEYPMEVFCNAFSTKLTAKKLDLG